MLDWLANSLKGPVCLPFVCKSVIFSVFLIFGSSISSIDFLNSMAYGLTRLSVAGLISCGCIPSEPLHMFGQIYLVCSLVSFYWSTLGGLGNSVCNHCMSKYVYNCCTSSVHKHLLTIVIYNDVTFRSCFTSYAGLFGNLISNNWQSGGSLF